MAECEAEISTKTRTAEGRTSPSEIRHQGQCHLSQVPVLTQYAPASPRRKHSDVLSPPTMAEKKLHNNGHGSPIRLLVSCGSPAGIDGFLRTDDRMRLAKERREEREKGLAAREQAIREKARRAQLQYERTVEERWRRLEEQRLREEQRRAAVEEKRRQREEEEKERMEALMRRSLERSLQLEQRPKRWVWGSPCGIRDGDLENALPPLSAASALPFDLAAREVSTAADCRSVSTMNLPPPLDPLITKRLSSSSLAVGLTSERAPSSPHRSPYRGSPGQLPETPKKENLRRDKRTSSSNFCSPLRLPVSPTAARHTTSPCKVLLYPSSPRKHCSSMKVEKVAWEAGSPKTQQRKWKREKSAERPEFTRNTVDKCWSKSEFRVEKVEGHRAAEAVRDTDSQETHSHSVPQTVPNGDSVEPASGHGHNSADPLLSTGKSFAGTTDAEEASKLLAERRRQARLQKEHEERLRLEHEKQNQQEQAQRAEAERQTQRERNERQMEREREGAELQAQKEAERQKHEREQQDLERLQRKKRIEEIMKRTRKSDSEAKKDLIPISPPLPAPRVAQRFTPQLDLDKQVKTHVEMKHSVTPHAAGVCVSSITPPLINLEPLVMKSSGADESTDETQSMEVSPASKEELISIPEFSPVSETQHNGVSNTRALEDLLDLTGHVAYPKLPPAAALGDCNKNLMEGFSPSADAQLIQSFSPACSTGH